MPGPLQEACQARSGRNRTSTASLEAFDFTSPAASEVGEDPAQWQAALAKALGAFPAAAGRLRQAGLATGTLHRQGGAFLLRLKGKASSRNLSLGHLCKKFLNGFASLRSWQIFLNNAGVPFTMASVPPCGLPAAEVPAPALRRVHSDA